METKATKVSVIVREPLQIKTNNRTPLEEKMAKTQMPYSLRELKISSKKELPIQSRKTHTTSHSSTRKMKITKIIKRVQETKVMKTNLLSSKAFQQDQDL